MIQCRTSISRLFVLIVADLDYLFELNHDCNTSHHSVKLIEWLREACNKKKIKSLVFFTPFIIYHIVIYVDIKKYWFILLFPTFPNTFPHWKLPSSTFKITLLISAVPHIVQCWSFLYSAFSYQARYWSLIGQQFPHSRPLTNQENLQFKLSNKLILTFVLFNCTIVYYYLYINTRLVSSKAAAVHAKIPNFSF